MRKKKIIEKELIKINADKDKKLKEIDKLYGRYVEEIKSNPFFRQKRIIVDRILEFLTGGKYIPQAEQMIKRVEERHKWEKEMIIYQAKLLKKEIKKWGTDEM